MKTIDEGCPLYLNFKTKKIKKGDTKRPDQIVEPPTNAPAPLSEGQSDYDQFAQPEIAQLIQPD